MIQAPHVSVLESVETAVVVQERQVQVKLCLLCKTAAILFTEPSSSLVTPGALLATMNHVTLVILCGASIKPANVVNRLPWFLDSFQELG